MRVFFDTSALVKRYVSEAGTDAVLEWCDLATEIGLSGIALPEMISAFCRLRREARITDTQYQQLKSLLFADIEDVAVCDLTPAVLAQAVSTLETSVLRGMDAIHIGSAVVFKADVSYLPTSGRWRPLLTPGFGSRLFEALESRCTDIRCCVRLWGFRNPFSKIAPGETKGRRSPPLSHPKNPFGIGLQSECS